MKAKGKHPANKLTALQVKRASKAGFYADGNGLYLKVDQSGAKRWVQRLVINGKRHDMGLGSAILVSLAVAREQAHTNRALARAGGDPLAEKRKLKILSFKSASQSVYELNKPTWKNEKHAQQWINSLETYVFPLMGDKKMDKIDSADVLAVLSPIWTQKPETAKRIRQRISKVFAWSIAQRWRTDDPARDIAEALPKIEKSVNHHKALDHEQVAQAIDTVKNSHALDITKLAFEFLVLTAGRSGEIRGALWSEIDGNKWEIPKERMKKKKPHRVPLSNRCMKILALLKPMQDGSGLLFSNNGKPLSDMTLSKLMKDLNIKAVPHGFRSSFRVWASEKTNYPWQVCEFALAHVVGDDAERAYQRSDLYETRQNMMESWAQYISNQKADVIPLIKNQSD